MLTNKVQIHWETDERSISFVITEDEKRTEFIYIFSNVFVHTFFKTNEKIDDEKIDDEKIILFVHEISDQYINKIEDHSKKGNGSIYDRAIYRFIFTTDGSSSKIMSRNEENNYTIKSYYFSTPQEAINFSGE